MVLDVGIRDCDASGASDVKRIGIVPAVGDVASGVVNRDVVERQVGSAVDGEALDWGVLDVEVVDGRLLHRVRVKELLREHTSSVYGKQLAYLWLLLSTISALAVPPLCPVAVDDMTASAVDRDLSTRDRNQRAFPLLVSKGGRTLKRNLQSVNDEAKHGHGGTYGRAILQLGEVESGPGRHDHILYDDGIAGSLVLDGSSSISKSAAGAIIQACRGSEDKRTSTKERKEQHGDHSKECGTLSTERAHCLAYLYCVQTKDAVVAGAYSVVVVVEFFRGLSFWAKACLATY